MLDQVDKQNWLKFLKTWIVLKYLVGFHYLPLVPLYLLLVNDSSFVFKQVKYLINLSF